MKLRLSQLVENFIQVHECGHLWGIVCKCHSIFIFANADIGPYLQMPLKNESQNLLPKDKKSPKKTACINCVSFISKNGCAKNKKGIAAFIQIMEFSKRKKIFVAKNKGVFM